MKRDRREFIINELMVPGFMENMDDKILLEEKEESGRSKLNVQLMSKENLCIANVDKKHTDLCFFQDIKDKSMKKRVDHIIFEHQGMEKWRLHLIEMKGSVQSSKWVEIKGKFRASYLLSQAIAGMLELNIEETIMYTTFEKVQFSPSKTMPSARRVPTGIPLSKMEQEWSGQTFGINLGEHLPFKHVPIQMRRNEEGILVGDLTK